MENDENTGRPPCARCCSPLLLLLGARCRCNLRCHALSVIYLFGDPPCPSFLSFPAPTTVRSSVNPVKAEDTMKTSAFVATALLATGLSAGPVSFYPLSLPLTVIHRAD